MKIWNNSWVSKDLINIFSFSRNVFIHKLSEYFQTCSYGEGVNEIFYIEVCENPVFSENPYGKILSYGKRKKIIEIGLQLDFDLAQSLNGPAFARYLANTYLERSLEIESLKVENFDLEKYITDLETFFKLKEVL